LALAQQYDGKGTLEVLASFMTNPAGSAIVNTTGPIRQVVQAGAKEDRRWLVIAEGKPGMLGKVVQRQVP
jgi:hypothetical protein